MQTKKAVTVGLIVIYTYSYLYVSFVIHPFGFVWTDMLAVGLALTKISGVMCYKIQMSHGFICLPKFAVYM